MKKFAIPLENGRLCSHFGHCQQFAIIETMDGKITVQNLVTPPPHEPGLLPQWLSEHGVTHVIAGGIGQKAINLFNGQNIQVTVGAQPKQPAELVEDWLTNSLVSGANACDH
ncbi:NifB/NifX family molybdenum-iron cluster-binding protein [Gaoshiqia sediminis]|uniref:NifB/NifX family molybdenum-iron cluster-binding protein n=1 Tax=Gaoshiqia sediminis TaxID=2986998 RepID=A0AA41Y920_9BACT|nr:NifB/NifX family molybdenum-iron cluster-binding protein [Gaoshiqia sediminis]MCW0484329.1 NifB/NifX family molybdenum-iron cluster-binding protein [Gaoshiqia sediminis]